MPFLMFEMENFHFPNICFMEKRPGFCCTFFIWLVIICHLYVNLCVYKKSHGSGFFVLAFGSASDRSRAKCSVIFLKMQKPNHVKKFYIFIFAKHFSASLPNIYG